MGCAGLCGECTSKHQCEQAERHFVPESEERHVVSLEMDCTFTRASDRLSPNSSTVRKWMLKGRDACVSAQKKVQVNHIEDFLFYVVQDFCLKISLFDTNCAVHHEAETLLCRPPSGWCKTRPYVCRPRRVSYPSSCLPPRKLTLLFQWCAFPIPSRQWTTRPGRTKFQETRSRFSRGQSSWSKCRDLVASPDC